MKALTLCGIDVGATELLIATSTDGKPTSLTTFPNTSQGHKSLIKRLTKSGRSARVCMEATGIYHFELALSLSRTKRIEVSVVNPRAIKSFAGARLQRAKTDKVDANLLLDYVTTMPFKAWEEPDQKIVELQCIARRMVQLADLSTQEKNRLHASEYKSSAAEMIQASIQRIIESLQDCCSELEQKALEIIKADKELKEVFDLITSITGFAEKSTIKLMAEILWLPKDMRPEQWVAHAGLDPKPFESGSSINKHRCISRMGNKYLRTSLYMPALTAKMYDPHVKAFYDKLVAAGKKKKQALVAVMRKLLRAIWGMLHYKRPWDGSKFYVVSA